MRSYRLLTHRDSSIVFPETYRAMQEVFGEDRVELRNFRVEVRGITYTIKNVPFVKLFEAEDRNHETLRLSYFYNYLEDIIPCTSRRKRTFINTPLQKLDNFEDIKGITIRRELLDGRFGKHLLQRTDQNVAKALRENAVEILRVRNILSNGSLDDAYNFNRYGTPLWCNDEKDAEALAGKLNESQQFPDAHFYEKDGVIMFCFPDPLGLNPIPPEEIDDRAFSIKKEILKTPEGKANIAEQQALSRTLFPDNERER